MSRPAGKPARAVTPGSQCWVRSRAGVAPYELVRVSEVSADATALVVADAAGEAGEAARWRVRCAELHPANVETQADNVALFEFSEAALLDNILRRYADATPYTYTGAILTSVNPCTPLRHLYTGEVMASYVGQRLSDDMTSVMWADPDRKRKGKLKLEAVIQLNGVSAVVEGVKSELLKNEREKSITARGFKAKVSGIKSFDAGCCLSVLGRERSLDLQAPNRLVAAGWVAAFQLVLAHIGLQGLEDVNSRARLRGFVPRR